MRFVEVPPAAVPLELVQAAVTYYGAHTDEIDRWIEANEHAAEEGDAARLAGHAALARSAHGRKADIG